MKNSIYALFLIAVLAFFFGCNQNQKIKVLILSGSNNHEWKSTTPVLQQLYLESGLFEVAVTEKPDTLKSENLDKLDVIVSNWNSWPENDLRWPGVTEKALLDFVEKGGGFVTFHASTSVFYEWPEFKKITTASWEEETGHGEIDTVEVYIENQNHPVTRGMNNFVLVDELWLNARQNENYTILGSATDKTQKAKGNKNQPAIFVKKEGSGRIFHTILGHDIEAMKSNGFKKLILRGTEWAAKEKVTIE